jgi:U3 small nucleolar RNA-associated protein 12
VVKFITPVDTLPLATRHRVAQVTFHPSLPYIAVQSHERSVEIFRIRTEEEAQKKQLRRQRRAKEKSKQKGEKDGKANDEEVDVEKSIEFSDLFTPHLVLRASGKIRSFDLPTQDTSKSGFTVHSYRRRVVFTAHPCPQIFLALASNALEVFNVPPPTKSKELPEATRLFSLDLPGHRTDVRTLSLSSDDKMLASASNGSQDLVAVILRVMLSAPS